MRRINQFSFAFLCVLMFTIYPIVAETVNITVGSTTRSMIIYAPAGIATNRPLIISMHGSNQDAAYQQSQSKWEPIADAEKFLVVFPNGNNKQWALSGTTDINFILAIIDYMSGRYGIDRNRVYLSGFSMGGMMTYYAATQIADKIAAFAPISGYLMGGPNTNSSRPIPIIHTHGTADDVVGYSGVATCINAWKTRNGCPSTAVITDPYPTSNPNSICTKYYYGPGTNGVAVVLMSLEGKGHWISIDPTNGINTSLEIWNFCKNYSLNNSCTPTSITPYLQVNDGTWQQTSSVTVSSGAKVKFGPQPASGGSWSWSGCGTSGTSREQTVYPTGSCTATATYTNSCGAQSTQNFTVTVSGGSTSTITIQENTTGFCSVDGTVANSNSGYTGTGYADTNSATGTGVSWSVNIPSAGTYTLKWRYASASSRPANLKVDGITVVSNVAFASTGSWTTWVETATTSVNLAASTRVIRLEATTSAGLGNIDYMTVTGVSPSGVACSGVKSAAIESPVAVKPAITSTEYYTLTGKRVYNIKEKTGIFILRTHMSDGTISTSKIFLQKEHNK